MINQYASATKYIWTPLVFEESIDCSFMFGSFLLNICQFYVEQDISVKTSIQHFCSQYKFYFICANIFIQFCELT